VSEAEANSFRQTTPGKAPLVEGSLWHAIWSMSWPLLLTTFSASIVGIVDLQVAGTLGSAQQATVGVCEHILFLVVIFIFSISVGTTALVSRAYGAGNLKEAVQGTGQSITIAVAVGGILAVVALALTPHIIMLSTQSQAVLTLGRPYLQIYALYLIPFSINAIINAAFRAIGDAKTPLLVVASMTAVNILGDYTIVIGNWPVPGLGIKGIAVSALVASTLGSMIALYRLKHSALSNSLLCLLPINPSMIYRILKVGLPAALHRLSWTISVFVLFFILSRCPNPTQALASWTIGMRVEGLIFMNLMALSLAVASIVGQSLGAHETERAFKAGWRVTWIGVWMMIFTSTGLFLLAKPIAQVMSHDPQTIVCTTDYLKINALAEPFLGLAMVISGALQGAGDTRTPMWISIFCNWMIRLPLAWLLALSLGLGPHGAWIAMATSVVISGLLSAWRYQSRQWIKIQV
jgi:putative MATE family efflux protein